MTIRKVDILDTDIVDSEELASDGYGSNSYYLSSISVTSTTSLTKTVIIGYAPDGEGILYGKDHPVEYLDRIRIYGTVGGLGDGYYTVNTIESDTSFTVLESISDSIDGYVDFMHPSGASRIGVNPLNIVGVTANKLQTVLEQLSHSSVGITADQHESIRQLIHFINEGPANGFASGAYKEILPIAAPFPTSIIWYTDATKTNKIVEKTIAYNSNKTPNTITWKMYDASNVLLATIIDTIAYNGIFETNRTRTII